MTESSPSALASDGEGWHAQFSPSSSERWLTCPGSIAITKDIPSSGSSKYADEGTAAHNLGMRALTYGHPCQFWLGEEFQVGNSIFTFTQEMCDYVQVYVDEVNARVEGGTLMVEQRVWFSDTIGVADQGGTSDAIILAKSLRTLQVGDLKYGMGVRVEAKENTQMMTYAVAVLETYDAIMEDVEEVTLFIAQPRLDHIDEWTCSVAHLREHAKRMRAAAVKANDAVALYVEGFVVPSEYFAVSEDGCRWCPAKATCDAYRKHVSALVFDDFEVLEDPSILEVTGKPAVPAGEKLGQLYGVLDLIEDWCRGVRSEIERMVFAGMEVIGPDGERMKLVEGKAGNRAWQDSDAAKAVLAGLLPPDKYLKPQEIITPAVADKLFKKDARKTWNDMLAPLIVQKKGAAKVTLGSDPAPPYSPEASESEFEDLGAPE